MRILFLHGFPDNPEVWRYCVEFLEGRAVCRTPELHSLRFEDQLKRVLEMTEDGPAVLVGHDMGGPLATKFAQLHPERVSRIVLVNSMDLGMFVRRLGGLKQLMKSSYMGAFINPLVNTTTLQPFTKQLLKFVYDRGRLPAHDRLRSNSAEVLDGLGRYKEMALRAPQALMAPITPVSQRVDIIFGEYDPFLQMPTDAELKSFFQDAQLHKMKSGHWPMRTHPEDFHKLLEKILL
jgi:pimeloyl-ACP methyl ester carboxylesterase